MRIMLFILPILWVPASTADSYGSYIESLNLHPEITRIINGPNAEDGCRNFVNEFDGSGVGLLFEENNFKILAVSYINDCSSPWGYYNTFIEVRDGEYAKSSIAIPLLFEVKIGENEYSLHKPISSVKDRRLEMKYQFACREPATFIMVGDCSDRTVYEVSLEYEYENGELVLINKSFAEAGVAAN